MIRCSTIASASRTTDCHQPCLDHAQPRKNPSPPASTSLREAALAVRTQYCRREPFSASRFAPPTKVRLDLFLRATCPRHRRCASSLTIAGSHDIAPSARRESRGGGQNTDKNMNTKHFVPNCTREACTHGSAVSKGTPDFPVFLGFRSVLARYSRPGHSVPT
jgi:hypothetical protein